MVATSTPAALRAVRAVGGARKLKSLAAGVPRSVMAVSRFTTARSARRRTLAIGPKVVAGSAASRDSMAPSKWKSTPKARVTGSPVGSLGSEARLGAVVVGGAVVAVDLAAARVVVVAPAAWPGSSSSPQALSNSNAARVSEATTWRRVRTARRGWGGRGTAGSRLRRSGKRRLGSHAVTRPCQGCSAAQARAVHPGRAHGVAARRPRRAEDLAQHVVGPGGDALRPQQPAEARARPALTTPLGGAYLAVPLGVGVQLGDALVAEVLVHVFPAHDILLDF